MLVFDPRYGNGNGTSMPADADPLTGRPRGERHKLNYRDLIGDAIPRLQVRSWA